MMLRVLRILVTTGIVFLVGGVVVWPRVQLEAGSAGSLDDVRTVMELRTQIAGLERQAAAGEEVARAMEADEHSLLAEARAERDGMAQRLDNLARLHADLQAERNRVADALDATERELAELRGVASRAEQDLTLLRAEMLWQKVRTPERTSNVSGNVSGHIATPPERPTADAAATTRDAEPAAAPRRMVRQERQRLRKPPADEPKISWNPFSSLP